jgi:hypothetical protein
MKGVTSARRGGGDTGLVVSPVCWKIDDMHASAYLRENLDVIGCLYFFILSFILPPHTETGPRKNSLSYRSPVQKVSPYA